MKLTANLTKVYKEMFKEILMPLGFIMKGSLFIKVTNEEIIQTVNIFKSSPIEFTLNIGIHPFSVENDRIVLKEGGYRLYEFVEPGEFEYNPHSMQSIKNELEKCLDKFKKKILPILNSVQTENEFLIFEEDFEMKKYSKIRLLNENKLFINLKLRKYSEALKVVEGFINQKTAAKTIKYRDEFDKEDEFQLFLKDQLKDFYMLKHAIESNDIDYLDKIVQANINNTKKILKDYGYKF